MSNAKHTPGPWTFDYTGGGQVRAKDDKGSFPVCDIRGWGHLTGKGIGALGLSDAEASDIQSANAHLIAAAPDMLAALKGAMVLIDAFAFRPEEAKLAAAFDSRRSAVLAAIAKAIGET